MSNLDLPLDGGISAPVFPRLCDGIQLLGQYESSGLRHPRYLARRADGQIILLSEILYAIAETADGQRQLGNLADEVAKRTNRALTAADVAYLIDTKLSPLGLLMSTTSSSVETPRANPVLSLAARRVLMPARAVNFVSAIFRPLFFPAVIVAALAGLGAVDGWLVVTRAVGSSFTAVIGHPPMLLTVMGLVVVATLFHEWGHATACRYGGGKPGHIGMGIYLLFPAFYTNVTDSYRLNRRGRLRTDLGGVYFNAVFIVATGGLFAVTRYPPLAVVVVLTHLEMLQQLVPVVRLDGYYVLADLVGVPDLFARIGPILSSAWQRRAPDRRVAELTRRTRWIVTAWVAVVVPALLASLVLFVLQLPHFASVEWRSARVNWRQITAAVQGADWGAAVLAGIALIVLAVPLAGLAILAGRSAKGALAAACHHGRKVVPLTHGAKPPVPSRRNDRRPDPVEHRTQASCSAGRSKLSVTAALMAAAALMGTALPAGPQAKRSSGFNTVIVVTNRPGQSRAELGWQRARLSGPHAVAANVAVALDRCDGCLAESVAMQIVLVPSAQGTIDASNEAVAVSRDCQNCQSFAVAYQFIVISSGELYLTPLGREQLRRLHRSLERALDRQPPPAELLAYTSLVANDVRQVLATQLRTSGLPQPASPQQGLRSMSVVPVAQQPQIQVRYAEQSS